jgi:hypothetical protein
MKKALHRCYERQSKTKGVERVKATWPCHASFALLLVVAAAAVLIVTLRNMLPSQSHGTL